MSIRAIGAVRCGSNVFTGSSTATLRFPFSSLPSTCALRNSARSSSSSSSSRRNAFGSTLPEVIASGGWEGAWSSGVTPWDAGKPAPLVSHLLSLSLSHSHSHSSKARAPVDGSSSSSPATLAPLAPGPVLVPGAGAGYDAIAFAAGGRATTALDIAPTAIEQARSMAAKDKEGAKVLDQPGGLEIRQADFFNLQPSSAWGVIFDYAFLCSFPHSMRGEWARAVTRLIRPDGELIIIIFPVGEFKGGPPYAMQPTTVRDLLLPLGWVETCLHPLPDELSHPARAGREWVGRYTLLNNRYPAIHVPGAVKKERMPKKKQEGDE